MEEIINVQIINMDVMIPEQITRNSDGSYTIFLNARLTHEHRLQSYEHALRHIRNGDFDRESGDIQQIEVIAHTVKTAEPLPVSVSVNDEKRQKRLAAVRRRRRQIEKKLRALEEDMKFLSLSDDEAFDRAEQQWLYGNNL